MTLHLPMAGLAPCLGLWAFRHMCAHSRTSISRPFRWRKLPPFLARKVLARISHNRGCIGPKNLRKLFCNKALSDSGTGSDANRLYL